MSQGTRIEAAVLPMKPGYYWAKWRIAADGTHEGGELTPSNKWEMVQVNANVMCWEDDPADDEALSVSVPGVRETQWRDCFVWGSFVAPLTAADRLAPDTVPCPVCQGSGFSGQGSGYGDVCSHCGGQKEFSIPAPAPVRRESLNQELVEHCAQAAQRDFGIYGMSGMQPDILWQAVSATVIHEAVLFLKANNQLEQFITARTAPDTAAALGEDDAKFLDQVATMVSRNDGDPPNSEGIMALKLRAIAAALRKAGPA